MNEPDIWRRFYWFLFYQGKPIKLIYAPHGALNKVETGNRGWAPP